MSISCRPWVPQEHFKEAPTTITVSVFSEAPEGFKLAENHRFLSSSCQQLLLCKELTSPSIQLCLLPVCLLR